jgi:hypothetical protein
MGIRHSFTSARPEGTDPTKVRKDNWNADHIIDNGTITAAMLATITDGITLDQAGLGLTLEIKAVTPSLITAGDNGYVLTTVGGVTTWAPPSGSSASPAPYDFLVSIDSTGHMSAAPTNIGQGLTPLSGYTELGAIINACVSQLHSSSWGSGSIFIQSSIDYASGYLWNTGINLEGCSLYSVGSYLTDFTWTGIGGASGISNPGNLGGLTILGNVIVQNTGGSMRDVVVNGGILQILGTLTFGDALYASSLVIELGVGNCILEGYFGSVTDNSGTTTNLIINANRIAIPPHFIAPGINGQVLATVGGVAAWATLSGGGLGVLDWNYGITTTNAITNGQMVGLGQYFTPATTGNVMIFVSGAIYDGGDGGTMVGAILRYGTGAAPAQGAAVTGQQCSNYWELGIPEGATSTTDYFNLFDYLPGLAVGTQYWIDLESLWSTSGISFNQVQVLVVEVGGSGSVYAATSARVPYTGSGARNPISIPFVPKQIICFNATGGSGNWQSFYDYTADSGFSVNDTGVHATVSGWVLNGYLTPSSFDVNQTTCNIGETDYIMFLFA